MPSLLVTALASAIPVLGVMGFLSLRHQRLERFKDFPQPKTSVVWGHMAVLAEEMKKALKDAQFGKPPSSTYVSTPGSLSYQPLPPIAAPPMTSYGC